MTRARAAAKASEPSTTRTTKIVTAATKAVRTAALPASLTASTKSTAAKRKMRDEDDEEDERQMTLARRPRGRPKKAPDSQEVETFEISAPAPAPAPAPAKTTRVRAARNTTTKPAKEEPVLSKATRGRSKKAAASAEEEEQAPQPEPITKTARGRAASVTKTTATNSTAKTTVRKTVKFQEPDKENVEPAIKAKEPPAAGLRGRPARRGGATAARGTRAGTKPPASEDEQKKPLSPKKVTQMPVSRDDESEDELALEKAPVKAMMKSPIKPPTSPKKYNQAFEEAVLTMATAANTVTFLDPPERAASILASPVRRPASPTRDTMKSPAKRIGPVPFPGSAMKPIRDEQTGPTPFMANLLQSAAKRPQSPIKGLSLPSAQKPQLGQSAVKVSMLQSPAKRAMPGLKPFGETQHKDLEVLEESPGMKPLVLSTPTPGGTSKPSRKLMLEEDVGEEGEENVFEGEIDSPHFSGRLSAVLPRYADPSLKEQESEVEDDAEDVQLVQEATPQVVEDLAELEPTEDDATDDELVPEEADDLMALDDVVVEMESSTELPAKSPNPVFQLRQKDLDPCYDMSLISEEGDEESPTKYASTTPCRQQKTPKSRDTGRSVTRQSRRSTLGLTSLAEQLDSWSAASPIKASRSTPKQVIGTASASNTGSKEAVENSFFEDEMLVHADPATKAAEASPDTTIEEETPEVLEPSFDDIMITEEDVALAQEANNLSVMEPEREVASPLQSFDDSLSDASQEYGDENQVPVDPAILGAQSPAPTTPVRRPIKKLFHTTTKVPLKPADDSSLSPVKQRSFSASRAAPKRPSGASRSASVISYSPAKDRKRRETGSRQQLASPTHLTAGPTTPGKSDSWSTSGTPTRTPRKDLDSGLLRGAIVFVDVHTSDGADASGIFVELLNQMGARCVKSWNWNPSGSSNSESSLKIGITHVVYKDGSRRTLEKVKEANGVVQCVGVSWVLE